MIISRLSANRLYVLWLAAATMMACLLTVNARQEPASPAGALQGRFKLLSDEGTLRSELMKLPGTLIAEGKNNQPIGELRLRRYRVEELVPETAVEAEISGRRVQLHKAWRLTILGGPFRVGNAPLIAWIDGKPIGIAGENPDLKSVSIIIFDEELIREGASMALSYGVDYRGRSVVPERMELHSQKKGESR